jgi:hypothetical protein
MPVGVEQLPSLLARQEPTRLSHQATLGPCSNGINQAALRPKMSPSGAFSPHRLGTSPGKSNSMLNYVVDATLKSLREEGVWVDPKVEEYDYGKFGWIMGSRRQPHRTLGTPSKEEVREARHRRATSQTYLTSMVTALDVKPSTVNATGNITGTPPLPRSL